jgi:protein TonB
MNARTLAIVIGVVVFHLAALWALHTGLIRRVAEVVVPVMLVSTSQPPPPKPEPPPK